MMMMMMEWNGDGRVGGLQRAKQDDQSSDGHLLMASITLGIPILDLPGTLPPFSLFFYFLFFFFCFFFFSSCILRRTHTHHSPIFLLSIYSFPFLIRPICPIINVTCFKSLCVCDYNQDQQPQALPTSLVTRLMSHHSFQSMYVVILKSGVRIHHPSYPRLSPPSSPFLSFSLPWSMPSFFQAHQVPALRGALFSSHIGVRSCFLSLLT